MRTKPHNDTKTMLESKMDETDEDGNDTERITYTRIRGSCRNIPFLKSVRITQAEEQERWRCTTAKLETTLELAFRKGSSNTRRYLSYCPCDFFLLPIHFIIFPKHLPFSVRRQLLEAISVSGGGFLAANDLDGAYRNVSKSMSRFRPTSHVPGHVLGDRGLRCEEHVDKPNSVI